VEETPLRKPPQLALFCWGRALILPRRADTAAL
jgi:hypothetical protein